ncbi:MAG TPA: AraC family transcriptional regulator [Chitinophagaceae bacterium]
MVNLYELAQCHPGQFKQFRCKEILFLIVECPPDFVKGQEFAQHNCFIYGLAGKHLLFNSEKSWLFEQGQTVFVKKGGMGVQRVDDGLFCVMIFYVPDSYLHAFINEKIEIFSGIDAHPSDDLILPIETNDVLHSYFDSVLSYFNSECRPAEDLIELKFKELLLNIFTNPANNELKQYIYRLSLSADDQLHDVMIRNYMYDLKLEDYARLCHRSLASFKRDFQKIYETTPGRWLLQKRLEKAKHLLLCANKSVNDAAFESGFKNNTHFSRVFRNFSGFSPLQFKKSQLQLSDN